MSCEGLCRKRLRPKGLDLLEKTGVGKHLVGVMT